MVVVPLSFTRVACLCLFFFGLALGLGAGSASAATSDASREQPITIHADRLEITQSARKAVFEGNVKAMQGAMTLRSQRMTVHYAKAPDSEEEAGAAGQGAASSLGNVRRIDVVGNVRLNTPQESATARRGVYDADARAVMLRGDVVLKRDGNVLGGERLEYHVPTGRSLLHGDDAPNVPKRGGRVKGIFMPPPKNPER